MLMLVKLYSYFKTLFGYIMSELCLTPFYCLLLLNECLYLFPMCSDNMNIFIQTEVSMWIKYILKRMNTVYASGS